MLRAAGNCVPLAFLRGVQSSDPKKRSLGDTILQALTNSPIMTLVDCLPSTDGPALFSPDLSREPLTHQTIRAFVRNFVLPMPYFLSLPPASRLDPRLERNHARAPLGPNDRVLLVLPTGPENALALLAVAAYHTCAPVNFSCTAAELFEDALRLDAKAVLTTRDAETRLELGRLRAELGCAVVFVEGRETGPAGLFDMSVMRSPEGEDAVPVQLQQEESQQEQAPRTTPLHGLGDLSLVLHTSGTSGKKKVVPHSLLSLIVGTCAVIESWDLRESDINLNMMPLFHVGGIVRNLLAPIFSGGGAIMCAGFDAIAFWTLARDLQATWYYAAPTIHHAILASLPPSSNLVPARDLRLRMIANAAGGLLPSLAVRLRDTFAGAVVLPSYGMTECMPIATPPITYALERPGTSGIACGPHLSIRHPLDLEHELPAGETGAVCVRGVPTFEGAGSTRATSGTSMRMDISTSRGAQKEIINRGGEVVSPFEVEEAVVTAGKGWIERSELSTTSSKKRSVSSSCPPADRPRVGLAQLQDLLRDALHPSKWPFALVYMPSLPKNAAGKPLRIKLATRLGIPKLSDTVPALHRHYQVDVEVDLDEVKCQLEALDDVEEAAVRAGEIEKQLASVLPGYAVPQPVHVLVGRSALPRTRGNSSVSSSKTRVNSDSASSKSHFDIDLDYEYDFDFSAMEGEVARLHAASMGEHALRVRNIIGKLLDADASLIRPDSDFFLLGGNSLLLGKLAYQIRRQTGVAIAVARLFTNSTIEGIAGMIEQEKRNNEMKGILGIKTEEVGTPQSEATTLNVPAYEYEEDEVSREKIRGQTHPLTMIVQAMPFMFFYPLKAAMTWTVLLLMLSVLAPYVNGTFWERIGALMCAIVTARLTARVVAPVTAILFKWLVIGRYKPGTYRMWSLYHLRWWLVDQSLRIAGRGIFSAHSSLEILYYRLLGARIGRNVCISQDARLGEYDLLIFHDGCHVDTALVRGFAVEREGCFRLDRVVIGERAVVNTFTQIAPGSRIAPGTVYGPHASARDSPSPRAYAAFNRTLLEEPSWWLKVFVAWPVMFVVYFVSYLPWFTALWLMVDQVILVTDHLNALEAVVYWFSSPKRVAYHALSRIVRAVFTPILRVALGIIVKRMFGLNKECATADASQLSLLRRYINGRLLSKGALKSAFSILGTHYEVVSVVFRCMGAKVGKRVYWPGSGIYCNDPELLEVGDDVVFGSRSEVFTTDRIGTARVVIGDGAMVADRVVLLPGCKVGRRAVMGSGALGMRDTEYRDGSTWLGSECLEEGITKFEDNSDTTTPFGRAFYKGEADYFVYPYALILLINIVVASLSAAYWSISAVAAAQILRQLLHHTSWEYIYRPTWYRPATIYGLIAVCFIIVLNIQAILSLWWVIITGWLVVGPRQDGRYPWDKSNYCQQWQIHLALSRFIYRGYANGGVLAPLTGTVYIVWFYRGLGAKIGKNCSIFAGGKLGLMTEPDLVEIGDNANLDHCSVVAHINSRGNFALNSLKIGNGCALRSGSRLLSGASMEDNSMLCEHTLLASGDVADANAVYSGWPAKQVEEKWYKEESEPSGLACSMCRNFPRETTSTSCGHIFCRACITLVLRTRNECPVCMKSIRTRELIRIYPFFAH
ncbi:Peroxisomal-coenzyme a synthetase [Mycena sanguinolenta]|uniref:Peroxisomal-coenzyme a synthetase n=1 Tax=Mycena sanguinolenta TaxID=230812 RepID=A0A8H7DE27_9AGAR|nr:Peroxisomal-coenzyme a synthetase [Mycena sanguinolenta]